MAEYATLIATIVGVVVSVASTVYSTVSSSNTAKFNSDMANRESQYATQSAAFKAKQHDIQMRQLLGEQRAGYASSGISLMSGSAQDVTGDTLEQGAIDAMVIRYGGQSQADKYSIAASNYSAEGGAAIVGGVSKVGGTLLSSYNTYQAQQKKVG